jgi:hypothetical protein
LWHLVGVLGKKHNIDWRKEEKSCLLFEYSPAFFDGVIRRLKEREKDRDGESLTQVTSRMLGFIQQFTHELSTTIRQVCITVPFPWSLIGCVL